MERKGIIREEDDSRNRGIYGYLVCMSIVHVILFLTIGLVCVVGIALSLYYEQQCGEACGFLIFILCILRAIDLGCIVGLVLGRNHDDQSCGDTFMYLLIFNFLPPGLVVAIRSSRMLRIAGTQSIGYRVENWIGHAIVHLVTFALVAALSFAGIAEAGFRSSVPLVPYAIAMCVLAIVGVLSSLISYFTILNRRPDSNDLMPV